MRDARPPAGDPPIRGLLLAREGPAPRPLRRHDPLHLVMREGQQAEILEQAVPRRPGGGGCLGHPLGMGAAGVRVTQQGHPQRRLEGIALQVDQETQEPILRRRQGAVLRGRVPIRSRGTPRARGVPLHFCLTMSPSAVGCPFRSGYIPRAPSSSTAASGGR
jgi:hypothetical protein